MAAHKMMGNGLDIARDGSKYWYENGLLHRALGPAIERANGTLEWWRHGELHRENGPAIMRADGSVEWWQNGKQVEPDPEFAHFEPKKLHKELSEGKAGTSGAK